MALTRGFWHLGEWGLPHLSAYKTPTNIWQTLEVTHDPSLLASSALGVWELWS